MQLQIAISILIHSVVAQDSFMWDQIPPKDVDDRIAVTRRGIPVGGGRITNGEIAEPKQFPYQVGLFLYLANRNAFCGGTLISDRWIVSAAHCVVSVIRADVFLGATNRTDRTEVGQQIVTIEKSNIIIHEGWDADNLLNDISLLKLPDAVEFSDYIKPAKLPATGETSTYEDEKVIASGWGRDSDSSSGVSEVLRWIEVKIMKNQICSLYYSGAVKETMICINTKGGKSTCNGDSGGPLVLADGSDTLIGATSFGIVFGCELQFPGVFTRITSYVDWIHEKTAESNQK